MSRIQISREVITCPFDPQAQFRDLRLLYWMMSPPTTIAGRILFVALTPVYAAVCVLFAFAQMLLDLCLSATTWLRIVRGY